MSEYDRPASDDDEYADRPGYAGNRGIGDDERTAVIPTDPAPGTAGFMTEGGGPDTAGGFGSSGDERAAAAAGYSSPFAPRSSYGQQPGYGQGAGPQNPYGQGAAGQGSYGQAQSGQAQSGQGFGGQGPYGQGAAGQPRYGQPSTQQSSYGQQGAYDRPGQPAYGQQPSYGQGAGQYAGQPAGGGPGGVGYAPWAPAPGGPGRDGGPGKRRGGVGILVAAGVLAVLLGGGAGLTAAELAGNGSSPAVAATPTATAAQPTVTQMAGSTDTAVEQVAASALPSVVAITVVNGQSGDTGSGVILSSDGLILTNNHVIAAAATGAGTITISFNDGSNAKASIVGRDTVTDLAVLKVAGKTGLKAATLGDSGSIAVGQSVVAVGSPLGLNGTVTTGIISALNRPVTSSGETSADQGTTINAMQTDAPINPGNSGGPLLNLNGQVIGINSAIAALPSSSDSQSGSIGLGFAIPINQITPIVKELESTGKATHAQLGVKVGARSNAATGLSTGAVITSVVQGGAAAKAGLKVNDVITAVQGAPITDQFSLIATIRSHRPDDQVSLTVDRGGKSMSITVTLGSDG